MNNSPVKIWRNQKNIRDILGKTGNIMSFTVIRVPPEGFVNQAPYAVVQVKTSTNTITGQLVDYDSKHLVIGQKVKAVLRRIKSTGKEGVIPYGVKFTPINNH